MQNFLKHLCTVGKRSEDCDMCHRHSGSSKQEQKETKQQSTCVAWHKCSGIPQVMPKDQNAPEEKISSLCRRHGDRHHSSSIEQGKN